MCDEKKYLLLWRIYIAMFLNTVLQLFLWPLVTALISPLHWWQVAQKLKTHLDWRTNWVKPKQHVYGKRLQNWTAVAGKLIINSVSHPTRLALVIHKRSWSFPPFSLYCSVYILLTFISLLDIVLLNKKSYWRGKIKLSELAQKAKYISTPVSQPTHCLQTTALM